jgi:site-specific recombinase XerD
LKHTGRKEDGKPEQGAVFCTERTNRAGEYLPFSRDGINKLVARIGERAGLGFQVFPHMLRHSAGYNAINAGKSLRHVQALLGHRSVKSTERYTELDENALKGFWEGVNL